MLINKLWNRILRRHGTRIPWASAEGPETHLYDKFDSNFLRENADDSLMSQRQNITPVLELASCSKPLSHRDKSSAVKLIRHCSRSIYSENIAPSILCLGIRRMNQLFSADSASCNSKKTHNAPIRKTTNWSRQ